VNQPANADSRSRINASETHPNVRILLTSGYGPSSKAGSEFFLRNPSCGLSEWLSFGGDVIGENDPDEQQKHLRYNDLVATAVILQNTVDMTRIAAELQREGWRISACGSGVSEPLPDPAP
jgi:hypothetical protein